MEYDMSRLQIVKYPGAVLRKKAVTVDRVTPELQNFMADMAEIMYESRGVGLAAPQVGISLRIIVVDTDDRLQTIINPKITRAEGSQTGVEGCLSLPGLHGDVTCAASVTVRGLNRFGKKITLSGEGLWARAIQHEIDHLDGHLFIDRVDASTLRWVTGETDENDNQIERPTTLMDALAVFERLAKVEKDETLV